MQPSGNVMDLKSLVKLSSLNTSEILKRKVGETLSRDRQVLQAEGERLDKETKGSWVVEELIKYSSNIKEDVWVVIDQTSGLFPLGG
jgi:hypothetical protein